MFTLVHNDGNLSRVMFFRSDLIFSRSTTSCDPLSKLPSDSVLLFNPFANERPRCMVIHRALNRLLNYHEILLTAGVIAIYEATWRYFLSVR